MNRRALRNRGISLLYGLVAMVVLTGFVSLGVDLGRMQLAKTELQAATDAASRYAASGLSSGVAAVKTRAVTAAAENKVDGTPLVLDPNTDIEFGTWNSQTRTFTVAAASAQGSATAVRITGRRAKSRGTGVPLYFGKLIGFASCDMKASAVSGCGQGADVFLIQDITTSFAAELPDAKIGDQGLLDALYASGSGWSRFAIAVHTGWGKTLAPFTDVAANYTYLTSVVSSIKIAGSTGMPVASGTDIASGFDEAIAAYTASGYVASAGGKTVVLISDGQPTSDSGGKHPTLNDTQLLTLAQTRADTLWANKVSIYVVFMDASNDNNAANKLKTLLRGNGDFVRVADSKDLPTALAEITKRMNLQLVK